MSEAKTHRAIISWALALHLSASITALGAGGWPTTEPPADSPMWWTLTDAVSPEDLRASLLDPAKHRERYLKAVEAGLAEPLPPDELERLVYFVDGSLTPERVRACDAFDAFAVGKLGRESQEERARSLLLDRYELSPEGVETVWRVAGEVRRQRAARIETIAPLAAEFIAALERAKEALPADEFRRAYESGDVATIAEASGQDIDRVRERAAAWERDVAAEVAAAGLELLKDRLSPSDWEGFRLYLLREVAASTSTIEFEEPW